MSTASRTVAITVTTDRGTSVDARRVLQDVIDNLQATDVTYLSVGHVTVTVRRAS